MTRTGSAHAVVPRAPLGSKKASLVLALVISLTIGLIFADAVAAEPANASASEHRLLKMINRTRHNRGVRTLRMSGHLSRLAGRHSGRMARNRSLFHSSGLARLGSAWGENVGVTYHGVRSIHRAFMRSSDHRSNILSRRFRRVGIGIRKARGRIWVTEIFSS
jgi:uncharacterized protein YkwD